MDYQSGNPALKNLLGIPLSGGRAGSLPLQKMAHWFADCRSLSASQSAVCLLHDPYPERMWVLLFIGLGIPLTLWLVFRRAPQWKWLQWSAVFAWFSI